MFYYINQPHTPPFPIGLVKTESALLLDQLRLAEGDERRWQLRLVLMLILFWLSQT